jgi:hypothetical protein
MKLEAVLDRLQVVRRNRDGWIARCPAHEDRSPSLSIREGGGGRLLLHCFAGCSLESICSALGIHVGNLFTERGVPGRRKPEIVRRVEQQMTNLRSRLTPRDRERPVTVVLCDLANLDAGLARALALAVEGELVQVALTGEGQ